MTTEPPATHPEPAAPDTGTADGPPSPATATAPSRDGYALPDVDSTLPPPPPPDRHAANQGRWADPLDRARARAHVLSRLRGRRSIGG